MPTNLYAISPGAAQDDAVVAHVLAHWAREEWARGIIFLPNRRSVTLVRHAFLRHLEGKASLLPTLLPLADIDPYLVLLSPDASLEMSQAVMSPLERRILLSAQVKQFFDAKKEPHSSRYAMLMADALGQFMDECVRHEAHCADFSSLVPTHFTTHWQQTLAFLGIVLTHWPQIEKEQGRISHAAYVHDGLKRLATAWEASPPDIPILAAGSTGSQPATANLLRVIASLPRGAVMVPGVPQDLTETYEANVMPGHPLFHVKHLAELCGMTLRALPQAEKRGKAEHFLCEAFSPDGVDKNAVLPDGHHMIACADEWEEARAISILVRQTLETPERTIMVVSPDRDVLQRVAAMLMRWEIRADSSSAQTMAEQPFVQWCMRLLALVESQGGALDTLAFSQHALTFADQPAVHEFFVHWLDMYYARGVARSRGQMVLERVLASPDLPVEFARQGQVLRDGLNRVFACHRQRVPMRLWLDTMVEFAEACGASEAITEDIEALFDELAAQSGEESLPVGECKLLLEYAVDVPWFAPTRMDYHPRVMLHSPIEARMVQADVVVLAGLNEGTWPKLSSNPWINRAMQIQLGLPTAEHELSLAAHDFLVLASQKEVYLLRAERVKGTITIPSRWWMRLELAAQVAQGSFETPESKAVLAWSRSLDVPETYEPAEPPRPNPDISLRPHVLRATDMEQLIFNPYAIYARYVLGLTELDEIDKEPDNALFGTLAHRVLEQASGEVEALDDAGIEALADKVLMRYSDFPVVNLLWRERLKRAIRFFIEEHSKRKAILVQVESEKEMELRLGDMRIVGRADRVESWRDGQYCFVDYKSGAIPTGKAIALGEAPQLLLYHMAHVQAQGGLDKLKEQTAHYAYWKLPQGADEGDVKEDAMAGEGVNDLLLQYTQLCAHYLFNPTEMLYAPHGGNKSYRFDALARAAEWGGPEGY